MPFTFLIVAEAASSGFGVFFGGRAGLFFRTGFVRGITGPLEFLLKLLLATLKLPHALAHASGELRQFLRSEEEDDDKKNDAGLGWAERTNEGEGLAGNNHDSFRL